MNNPKRGKLDTLHHNALWYMYIYIYIRYASYTAVLPNHMWKSCCSSCSSEKSGCVGNSFWSIDCFKLLYFDVEVNNVSRGS